MIIPWPRDDLLLIFCYAILLFYNPMFINWLACWKFFTWIIIKSSIYGSLDFLTLLKNLLDFLWYLVSFLIQNLISRKLHLCKSRKMKDKLLELSCCCYEKCVLKHLERDLYFMKRFHWSIPSYESCLFQYYHKQTQVRCY